MNNCIVCGLNTGKGLYTRLRVTNVYTIYSPLTNNSNSIKNRIPAYRYLKFFIITYYQYFEIYILIITYNHSFNKY